MPILRYSSRRQRLDESFLNARLGNAQGYDRIAGYFRASVLEIAGEAIEAMRGVARVVCNSDLSPGDVITAKAAQEAMRREWCAGEPEKLSETIPGQMRLGKLFDLLCSGKLMVRVLPDERFGFIHGKAGVLTLADGRKTAFLGSVNESKTAWRTNYELMWEDDSEDAVRWVQEEFDALWDSPYAIPLANAVIEDIERLSRRTIIRGVDEWRSSTESQPAAPIIEAPVYRREAGLWEHQKYFVTQAFEAHQTQHGARFVLADQVGLGKTLQLAMAAELMALKGNKPVLILAPKPLLWQWQDELRNLLDMPSAVWDGKQWWDENEIPYPNKDSSAIRDCPRWVGIASTGLITRRSEAAGHLLEIEWECVILDEAHRARRRRLARDHEYEDPEPNNLLAFMQRISPRTHSLLLATATPVQLHPVEAWDLLDALNRRDGAVLGKPGSPWRQPQDAVPLILGQGPLPQDDLIMWDWIRNPLPPASEGVDYQVIRNSLGMPSEQFEAAGNLFYAQLNQPTQARIRRIFGSHVMEHNPFIRHIIRRTRGFLETTLNPETNEPYLQPVHVNLLGDGDEDSIVLPLFLAEAYEHAERFCLLLKQRKETAGFLRTVLLRRMGSTIEAGYMTAQRLLGSEDVSELDDDEDETETPAQRKFHVTEDERVELRRLISALDANKERDPKYAVVRQLLFDDGWVGHGCIVFSQYYESVFWLAKQLSTERPSEQIGIYAGALRSGIMVAGLFNAVSRDEIKRLVRDRTVRLLIGTDAASEGLNLQALGTLINLDLPWNPTRLEQRKGRIQRIGQARGTIDVYNMRYRGSVEDRVHAMLSQRLHAITSMFGQLPDTLESVWIDIAQGEIDRAKQTIDAVPQRHPFEIRYDRIEPVDWESCSSVLNTISRKQYLSRGWRE